MSIAKSADIGFLIYPGFQILDLSGPLAVFEVAGRLSGQPYRLSVLSRDGGAVRSSCGLEVLTTQAGRTTFDTFIVAGGGRSSGQAEYMEGLTDIVLRCTRQARRIGSVCTGAFILAQAGLLDGKRVTTHWSHAAALQQLFPQLNVESDRIFIRDGSTWTSAGISAGIDLALALIEEDRGAELARAVARNLVVYHRRPGGQSQFSSLQDLEPQSDRIRDVLGYAREHLHEQLSVQRLADIACLSARQFGRAFLLETGQTPARAIEHMRVEVARLRIESGSESLEAIARQVGFSDPERMRRAFIRVFGQAPQRFRRSARDAAALAA